MKIQSIHSITGGNRVQPTIQPSFGISVHIIDGGAHADNMEHYAKAIIKRLNKDVNVRMHYIDTNRYDTNTKQMSSLEDKLKSLSSSLSSGDYLAIPGLASVPILNLQDRVRDVLSKTVYLTPQNIKSHKDTLLSMLKELYEYKYYYSNQISYMDKNSQDLAYVWGVIKEINSLVRKGVNVYIPSGHGADSSIKWKAKDEGYGEEMYRYIATGRDTNYGDIKRILNNAKRDNWYDFNLLSLSDAKIVNVKQSDNKDFVFSAYDTCVNDGARGVYNFYPVRNGYGKLLGYSYHDRASVEFPYGEFIANGQIANLCEYVGLKVRDFYPERRDVDIFRKFIRQGKDTSRLSKKLYPIKDVFDESQIRTKKLNVLGYFIDRDQRLILDSNSKGEILYQKTNCEGSDRPSVIQMWGSCFSAINAMIRDIGKKADYLSSSYTSSDYVGLGDKDRLKGYYSGAEYYYNKALDAIHPNRSELTKSEYIQGIYEKLYNTLVAAGKSNEAKNIGNILINLKSYAIKDKWTWNPGYMSEQRKIGKLYSDMAKYCEIEGESYPARVCRWAASELQKNSRNGDKIVQRRATQNPYIGDLYDECH